MQSADRDHGLCRDWEMVIHTTLAERMGATVEETVALLEELGVPRIQVGKLIWISGYQLRVYFERCAVKTVHTAAVVLQPQAEKSGI